MKQQQNTGERRASKTLQIGSYIVKDLVTVGKRVAVYVGHSTVDQRPVAIKVLHQHHSNNRKTLLQFYDDAKLAMQFDHPYIVPILEVNEDLGRHFVVTPWATQGSLNDFVHKQGPLWEDEAISLIDKLQSALHQIHDCIEYHGRLHPGNILMIDSSTPCISGVSRLPVGNDQRRTNERVPVQIACSAPEVLGHHEELNGMIDQFSLANILYFMLTGRLPCGRASLDKVLQSRVQQNPRWVKWLPTKTSPHVVQSLKSGLRTPAQKTRLKRTPNTITAQENQVIQEPSAVKTVYASTHFARYATYAKQLATSLLFLNAIR